jgi:hypothetical protein
VRLARLALCVSAIAATPGLAQQAGHATVPSTGAAAPGGVATTEREADPVLAKIDVLRRQLADLAKQYKKAKHEVRATSQVDVLTALGRAEAEVGAARDALTPR